VYRNKKYSKTEKKNEKAMIFFSHSSLENTQSIEINELINIFFHILSDFHDPNFTFV
jgi:hypothetical protein